MKRWVVLVALVGTSGCMTKLTHMHGDFACRAPNGTCAPMSVIDNAAIAGMGGVPSTAMRSGLVSPVGSGIGALQYASVLGGQPQRTSDRVLTVVFPAYVDESGTFHEESVARAVVEHGSWVRDVPGVSGDSAAGVVSAAAAAPSAKPVRLASLDEAVAVVSARLPKPVAATADAGSRRLPGLADAIAAAHAGDVEGLDPEDGENGALMATEAAPSDSSPGKRMAAPRRKPHRAAHAAMTDARSGEGLPGSRYTTELNRRYAAQYSAAAVTTASTPQTAFVVPKTSLASTLPGRASPTEGDAVGSIGEATPR